MGQLGDKLTHTRDIIQMRMFMRNLIKIRGVNFVHQILGDRSQLLQQIVELENNSIIYGQRSFSQIPVNANGKRVMCVPETIVDIVRDESSGKPSSSNFSNKIPKKTIEFIDLEE